MADIFSSVTASPTPTASAATDAPVVRLTLTPAAARQLQPYAGSGTGQGTVTLTVKQLLPGDLAVLALPNGQEITAQAPRTPLQPGMQLQLQVPTASQLAALASNTATNAALALVARLTGAPRAVPVARGGSVPSPVLAETPALTLANLENLMRQTPALAAAPLPLPAPPAPTLLLPGPLTLQPAPQPAGQQAAPLPAGPAVVQITALPPAPGQPQAALLFPIPPANQPAAAPAPLPVLVNAGQALPVGVEIPLTVPASPAPQPVTVQLPAPVALTPAPAALPAPTPLAVPGQPTAAPALEVTLPKPLPPAFTQPFVVRVIAPAQPLPTLPGQPQLFTQPVLLPPLPSTLPGSPSPAPVVAQLTTPQPLPPGTVLTLRPSPAAPTQPPVQSLTLPPQTPPPAPVPAPATQVPLPVNQPFQALVAANLPQAQGQARQVQLSVTLPGAPQPQTLVVNTPQPLPPGTALTLRLTPRGELVVEGLAPPPGLTAQQTLGTFESQWPQLVRAAARLAAQGPAALEQLAARLPQAAALTPGLASYVDALQHQNVQKWLGHEVVTMLRALGVDLTQDLSQLAILRQPSAEGWQGVIFPYLENPQGQPQQGRFFWKHNQPEDDQPRSGNTRFVVEMNLSQLGEVQLDGLLTYPELWLKLRLHPPADTAFAPGLQNVVQTLLQGFGLEGGLSVESIGTFPLDAARLAQAPTAPTLAAEL